jgi:PAS domain-containing protein
MRHVCAWCHKELEEVESSVHPASAITHGICHACAAHISAQRGKPLRTFLDTLDFPVLLVDSDVVVLGANQAAQDLLGKELPELETHRGGEVIECFYANLPAGCGQSTHCRSCAIRNTIGETFKTGKSFVREKAFPDIQLGQKVKTVSLEISTEKVANTVLLRIDDISAA